MKIAIVGAGVIGCASAVAIKETYPESSVTIFADAFSPHTTGDGSAGLWGPYILGDTSEDDVIRWAGQTHRWFQSLWTSGEAPDAGICLIPVTRTVNGPEGYPKPSWISLVYGPRELTAEDLRRLNLEHKKNYTGGWQFLTYTCEPVKLLPWLTKKFLLMGGKLERRKIEDLDDLASEGFDLIVNCCGLGARDLVKDLAVKPVRGQVIRVEAPWLFHCYIADDDDGNYIIPNTESVVLGGTHQENDYNVAVCNKDLKFIRDGCYKITPALKESNTLRHWVGLRPGRTQVRLEPGFRTTKNKQNYTVIHNYGHGGAGVTVSWGCALDIVKMIGDLKRKSAKSKL